MTLSLYFPSGEGLIFGCEVSFDLISMFTDSLAGELL